jgi:hypothetical protein
MGIKKARFNISKSLEDYEITPERNAMAAKWTLVRKQGWESKETAACKNSLKLADQALDKAKEQKTAETCLKMLENGRDKLINIAKDTMRQRTNQTS